MNNRKGFTVVELITTVTIIALLLGLLLPSITMVRTKAKEAAQKAQFATIEIALGAFKQDYGDYPPSSWPSFPPPTFDYCGAQKLSEALLGWDLMGFHPKSDFLASGRNNTSVYVYDGNNITELKNRKGPYLDLATANVFQLGNLFNATSPLASGTFVLCDIYKVRKFIDSTGKIVSAGAPILYYKANTSSKIFDANIPGATTVNRVYNYYDNSPVINLGKLTSNGNSGLAHPFAYGVDSPVFYDDITRYNPATSPGYGGSGIGYGIRDMRMPKPNRPYNPDNYILISAGPDGYYGTADDIHNF